ncbi:hypothetical protein SAICODRAFT_7173 [Saitoella complicata NRRL Y-17804]|uniref:SMP-30/Gluconolactonase/LRE-like region domain-containing protein n=1 Tax=Saitoella complicata (strain BCRC 22490 / CBS 7301 / JCM 7358 / NBRC 10748 / NRRL Y-17804) TaxID=698492 RepID=A0A0E9NME7_SAICN|nr:uncharacterized protein SAICODRAFT_7173 [Saitoella complicata NRRL Y-17804]ODQ53459.1 hypothetical protein SAICODRAFT_7173 [Saitoella complicata NRRL Y-17804]GAO51014.1 hypothetical protein G7K_5126-t1 [Saitoella complicata NRRL Y-17804]
MAPQQTRFIAFMAVMTVFTGFIQPWIQKSTTIFGFNREAIQHGTSTCTLEFPSHLTGCEDMHLYESEDGETRIMYLACSADLGKRTQWFPPGFHLNKTVVPEGPVRDNVFALDLNTNHLTRLDFHNFPADEDIVLHGFDFAQNSPHHLSFFFINHRRTGSVIEKFAHSIGTGQLYHHETFNVSEHGTHVPNDVLAISDSEFYVTNMRSSNPHTAHPLWSQFEIYTRRPWGHILHYSPSSGYSIAASNIPGANGITGTKDQVFVSAETDGAIYVYSRSAADGSLVREQIVPLNYMLDNPSLNPHTNELVIAGHPQIRGISQHQANPSIPAGSLVTRISVAQLGSGYFGGGNEVAAPAVEVLFSDYSGMVNASTTAVVDGEGTLWVTGLFTAGVAKCPNPEGKVHNFKKKAERVY